jgi:hypothetical protein
MLKSIEGIYKEEDFQVAEFTGDPDDNLDWSYK